MSRKTGETSPSPPSGPRYGRRRARVLTREERHLWQSVTADATPRPGRRRDLKEDPAEPAHETIADTKQARRAHPKPSIKPATPIHRPAVPPLTELDRRTAKRLVRGQLTPEGRLDLHGMTRHTAEPALLRFVADARAQGKKLVLVITGKGTPGHLLHGRDYHPGDAGRSVLRDLLPSWLGEPQFRTHVAGFQPAHPKHGGGGAFYLWLRRPR